MKPEVATEENLRLVFVRSALDNLRGAVGVAAACALLGERDLTVREARIRLEAERIMLEEAIAKGRGGKAISVPKAPAPAGMHEQPGAPNADFERLHPRANHGQFMKKGEDQSPRVRAMQNRMNELGHPTVPDGNFGPKTEAEVKAFQKKFGLPATGHVDPTTLEFMRNPPALTYGQANAELRAAAATAGQAVGPGSVGPSVATLQSSLVQLGYDTGMDQGSTYGKGTEAAVREIQRANGFAPTGRADEQTLALIGRLAREGTAQQAGNRLTGDSSAAWGLKPGAKPGVPTGRASGRATPKPKATPNRKLKVQHADDSAQTKGERVEESTAASVAAGSLAARAARILGTAPPGLREASSTAFAACASCVHFGGGGTEPLAGCQAYGGYPVDRDDVCDSWLTLTPEAARHDQDYSRNDAAGDSDVRESRELSEVKSSAYPGLDRSPKENWVDKAGGLPSYIERIAKHIHYEKGKPIGTAIAIAVGTVRRWCAGGEVAASGKGGISKTSGVSAKTKAQACRAVAEWEAKKKASKAKTAAEAAEVLEAAGMVYDADELLSFEGAYALYEADFKPIPEPRLHFVEKLLREVEDAHDDWDAWGEDGTAPSAAEEDELLVFAQEEALAAAAAHPNPELAPFTRWTSDGAHLLYVAGVPVRVLESASEETIMEAAAQALDLRLRRMNPTQVRGRASEKLKGLRGGFGKVRARKSHGKADREVAMLVSSKFAGRGAKPLTLGYNTRGKGTVTASPERAAVEGDASIVEGLGGRFDEILHPRGRGGEWIRKLYDKHTSDHDGNPYTGAAATAHEVMQTGGHSKADAAKMTAKAIDRPDVTPGMIEDALDELAGSEAFLGKAKPKLSKKPAATASDETMTVDQAIGGMLANYPGLKDWNVLKVQDDWHVTVTLADDSTHDFRVTSKGHVSEIGGKPTADAPAVDEPKPSAGGYELTGDHEKPYHMADGQVFQSKGGKWLKKHKSGKYTSSKGHSLAGIHVEDLETGDKKWVPAFAMKEHLPLAGEKGAAKKAEPAKSEDALHDDLMSSIKGGSGDAVSSFKGMNVVVTGKIEGMTRPDVEALIKAAGGTPQSSVSATTHMLVTGEKVGAAKTSAAKKHGVKVVSYADVAHLLEAELTPLTRRVLATHAELSEALDPGDEAALRARLVVLESRFGDGERRSYVTLRPDRATAVLPRSELVRA
jgi:peptidoglycan hydrolase-like protein with peptidoglycan-binding domain